MSFRTLRQYRSKSARRSRLVGSGAGIGSTSRAGVGSLGSYTAACGDNGESERLNAGTKSRASGDSDRTLSVVGVILETDSVACGDSGLAGTNMTAIGESGGESGEREMAVVVVSIDMLLVFLDVL